MWLQEIWLWNIWCEKWSGGEVLPFGCSSKGTAVAYNCQLLLLHFHFLSLCQWQLSLFITCRSLDNFLYFDGDNFHFLSFLLSNTSKLCSFHKIIPFNFWRAPWINGKGTKTNKGSHPHLCSVCFITFLDSSQANLVLDNFNKNLGFGQTPPPPCWDKFHQKVHFTLSKIQKL